MSKVDFKEINNTGTENRHLITLKRTKLERKKKIYKV